MGEEYKNNIKNRYDFLPNGNIFDRDNNVFLKKSVNKKSGYELVNIIFNNKRKLFLVHRLIAIIILPNPQNKPCVNHKNGIKTDNRVENLEWVTYSENMKHAFLSGLNVITKEQKENLRIKVVKKVVDKNTGIVYESIKKACEVLGLKYTQTKTHLSRKNYNLTPLKYT